jgi:hypothetical protein
VNACQLDEIRAAAKRMDEATEYERAYRDSQLACLLVPFGLNKPF